ncbi:hypothetical protein EDB83DRAFT_913218 [Lactarius deliciosus]|nr:hypothetical protein EDB83DRAFT_913218 [Lactarius deliciosus]
MSQVEDGHTHDRAWIYHHSRDCIAGEAFAPRHPICSLCNVVSPLILILIVLLFYFTLAFLPISLIAHVRSSPLPPPIPIIRSDATTLACPVLVRPIDLVFFLLICPFGLLPLARNWRFRTLLLVFGCAVHPLLLPCSHATISITRFENLPNGCSPSLLPVLRDARLPLANYVHQARRIRSHLRRRRASCLSSPHYWASFS